MTRVLSGPQHLVDGLVYISNAGYLGPIGEKKAQSINDKRPLVSKPEAAARAGGVGGVEAAMAVDTVSTTAKVACRIDSETAGIHLIGELVSCLACSRAKGIGHPLRITRRGERLNR